MTNTRKIIILATIIVPLSLSVASAVAFDSAQTGFTQQYTYSLPELRKSEYTRFLGSDARANMEDIHQRIWYNAFGNIANGSYSESVNNFSSTNAGLFAGINRKFGCYSHIGVGIGCDWSSIEQKNKRYKNDISNGKGLIYAQLRGSKWYWDLETGLGLGNRSTYLTRNTFERRESSWETQWNLGSEFGISWEIGNTKTEPFISLQRTELFDQDYDNTLTQLAVGCRHNWKFVGPLATMKPGVFGGYLRQFESGVFSTGSFTPAATVYRVPGASANLDRPFFGANLVMTMGNIFDVYVNYTSEFSGPYQSHAVLAGMNWNF